MACSAVVIELPNGVFITTTPAAVAAGMSTLSTPMPARPITFSRLAAAITSLSALVAERSGEAVVVADDLDQLVLGKAGLHVGVDAARPEDVDGGGRELVGDENAGGHGSWSPLDQGRRRGGTRRSSARSGQRAVRRRVWRRPSRARASGPPDRRRLDGRRRTRCASPAARRDSRRCRARRLPSPAGRRASWRTRPGPRSAGPVTARVDDLQADRGVGAAWPDPRPGSRSTGSSPTQRLSTAVFSSARRCMARQGRRSTRPTSARRDSPRRTASRAC